MEHRIVGRYIVPHPAILLPPIGKGEETKAAATVAAYEQIAAEIAAKKPSTIVIISPHAPQFSDYFYLNEYPRLSGDFSAFGHRKLLLGRDNDQALVRRLYRMAQNNGIPAGTLELKHLKQYGLDVALDYGITVPLAFIMASYDDFKLVPVSLSGFPPIDHYRYGAILAEVTAECDGDVVIVASGDLSHKLSEKSSYGYHASGPIFDETVLNCCRNSDGLGLLQIDQRLRDAAGQCGLESFTILLGTLEGEDFTGRVLSYEAPFGIGYMTASFESTGPSERSLLHAFREQFAERQQHHIEGESEPVQLARRAIAYYLKNGRPLSAPADIPESLRGASSGVFVSLYKYGILRGCIGSLTATCSTLAEEIIAQAIYAATADVRFSPVRAAELPELTITVEFIEELEEISGPDELDPLHYGLYLERGRRDAVLLPDIADITTAKEQVEAARTKGGIHAWSRVKYTRFRTQRYE